MKKVFAIAMAGALAFALAGCAAASKQEESSSSMQVADVSESSSSTSSSSEQSVKWTDAKTAAEAAKGAGINKFGVMKKIELNETEFKDPSFAYAGGVAQAVYESPATELTLRKSDGSHTAPLSDRDKTEFAQTWEKSYDGVDVTCYGEAHGAATVFTWTDGTQEYAVTWQGLGGDEMSMDSDEVAAIVKGVQAANAKDDASSSSAAAQTSDDQAEPSPLDGMDVAVLVQQNGLGEYVGATQQQRDDGSWYWDVTVRGADGNEYTCYIEADGTVSYNGYDGVQQGDDEDDPSPLDGMDPEALVQQNGLGDFVDASPTQRDDGSWYWDVTVRGVDGNEYTAYIEQDGSVSYNSYDGPQQGGA